VLTLTAISIDRYYAICHPLRFKSNLNQAKRIIGLIWAVSLLIMVPDLIYLSAKRSSDLSGAGLDTVLYSDCNYDWSTDASRVFQFVKTILLYLLPFVLMFWAHFRMLRELGEAQLAASKWACGVSQCALSAGQPAQHTQLGRSPSSSARPPPSNKQPHTQLNGRQSDIELGRLVQLGTAGELEGLPDRRNRNCSPEGPGGSRVLVSIGPAGGGACSCGQRAPLVGGRLGRLRRSVGASFRQLRPTASSGGSVGGPSSPRSRCGHHTKTRTGANGRARGKEPEDSGRQARRRRWFGSGVGARRWRAIGQLLTGSGRPETGSGPLASDSSEASELAASRPHGQSSASGSTAASVCAQSRGAAHTLLAARLEQVNAQPLGAAGLQKLASGLELFPLVGATSAASPNSSNSSKLAPHTESGVRHLARADKLPADLLADSPGLAGRRQEEQDERKGSLEGDLAAGPVIRISSANSETNTYEAAAAAAEEQVRQELVQGRKEHLEWAPNSKLASSNLNQNYSKLSNGEPEAEGEAEAEAKGGQQQASSKETADSNSTSTSITRGGTISGPINYRDNDNLIITMHNQSKLESRRKAAKMLTAIVVLFGICYLPVHLINFLR